MSSNREEGLIVPTQTKSWRMSSGDEFEFMAVDRDPRGTIIGDKEFKFMCPEGFKARVTIQVTLARGK